MNQIASLGARGHWLIGATDLCISHSKAFGSGFYGKVVEGLMQGTPIAVKLPKDPSDVALNSWHFTSQANELRVLRNLRHPHIVPFYGSDGISAREPSAKLGSKKATTSGATRFWSSWRVPGVDIDRGGQPRVQVEPLLSPSPFCLIGCHSCYRQD